MLIGVSSIVLLHFAANSEMHLKMHELKQNNLNKFLKIGLIFLLYNMM